MNEKIYKFSLKIYNKKLRCEIVKDIYFADNEIVREDIVMSCPIPILEELEVLDLKEVHYGR